VAVPGISEVIGADADELALILATFSS